MVLTGDLERTEGAPLTVGQLLYEIAPVDRIVVEAAVNEAEVALLETGPSCKRSVRRIERRLVGSRRKVHPRSEIRDSQNIFVAEIALDESDLRLRPGMKGRAKITTTESSVLGVMARRAWRGALWFAGW